MILTKIRLKNFKRFRKETEINLDIQNKEKNIVLIEAMNGVGKTSILQAVQWAFFGLDNSDFQRFLNYDARSENDFSMQITLEYNDNDFSPCKIVRTYEWLHDWSIPKAKLELYISWELQDPSPELWDDYLNKNFPKEVSNFFFFDGEKLQYLIDPKDPKKVKSAIEKILGIETIRNLRDAIIDLKSWALREIQALNVDKKIQIKEQQLIEQGDKKAAIKNKIDDGKIKLNELTSRKALIDIELTTLAKKWLTKEKLDERDNLLKKLSEKNAEIAKLDDILIQFRERFLDRFLLSTFWPLLKEQISKEESINHSKHLSNISDDLINKIVISLYEPRCIIWNEALSKDQKMQVFWVIKNTLTGWSLDSSDDLVLELSWKSENLIYWFMKGLDEADSIKVNDILDQKVTSINIRDAIERKIEDIDREIDLSTWGDSIDNLYQVSIEISQDITKSEIELNDLEVSLNKSNIEIQRLQREIEENMLQNVWVEEKKRYLDLLNRLNAVFDSHITSLASNTKRKLEEKTFQMFSLLVNSNVYSWVEITDDFEVKLIDKSGNHQDALNSGHMQILMTSMLWWLEQLSDYKLPIIIDTPLARLDPVHRTNMLEKYFSVAGWQVIILSQPSEITDEDKRNPLFNKHLRDTEYVKMVFNPVMLQTEVQYININNI